MALTIPTINKGNFELLNENIELITDILTDQQKTNIDQFILDKQQKEKDKKLKDIMFRANHPRLAKAKDLITKGWEKLIKMKWFDKITGFFKSMISNASGWIQTLTAVIFLLKSGILQQLIPWVLQIGIQLLQTLIKWAPTILKFVWNIITRTVPALLKGLFNTIFDTIGLPKDHPIRQFFNFVFDNFPKFADWLLKTFVDIFLFLGTVGGKIWEGIVNIKKWFDGGGVQRIIDDFLKFLKPIMPFLNSIKNVFNKIIEVGKDLINNVFGDVRQFFEDLKNMSFKDAIKNLGANLMKSFDTFVNDFKEKILPAIKDAILSFVNDILPKVIPTIESFIPQLKAMWEGMWNKILSLEVLKPILPFLQALKNIWEKIYETGYNLFKNVFGAFITFFQDLQKMTFGEALKNLFKNLIISLTKLIGDLITKVLPAFIGYVIEYGKLAIMGLIAVIAGTITVIGSLLGALWELFNGYVIQPIWNGIKNIGSNIWKGITKFVKGVKDIFFKTIPGALGKAVKFIISPFEAIFKKIVDIFDPIRKLVSSIGEGVKEKAKGFASGVKEKAKGFASGVKEKAKGFASGVYEKFISNPVSWVKNLFKGIVDGIKEIPKNIIKTIQGAFDWVIALFGIVGEVLSDPVKNFKMLSKENFSLNMKRRMTSLQEKREKKESYQNYKTGTKLSKEEYNKTVDPNDKKNWDGIYEDTDNNTKTPSILTGFQRREKGGPVEAGNPYIVNEGKKGELFVPSTDGNITSNKEIKEMVDLMKKMVSILERGSNPQPTPSFTPLARAR
jgi:phage-related protein